MKCAAAKIASKLLNFEEKQLRMDIAQEMLTTDQNNCINFYLKNAIKIKLQVTLKY